MTTITLNRSNLSDVIILLSEKLKTSETIELDILDSEETITFDQPVSAKNLLSSVNNIKDGEKLGEVLS